MDGRPSASGVQQRARGGGEVERRQRSLEKQKLLEISVRQISRWLCTRHFISRRFYLPCSRFVMISLSLTNSRPFFFKSWYHIAVYYLLT